MEGAMKNSTQAEITTMITDYAYTNCYSGLDCYYSHWQYEWYEKLLMYVPPILILLGTVGNILNLIVLQGRLYRDFSI